MSFALSISFISLSKRSATSHHSQIMRIIERNEGRRGKVAKIRINGAGYTSSYQERVNGLASGDRSDSPESLNYLRGSWTRPIGAVEQDPAPGGPYLSIRSREAGTHTHHKTGPQESARAGGRAESARVHRGLTRQQLPESRLGFFASSLRLSLSSPAPGFLRIGPLSARFAY